MSLTTEALARLKKQRDEDYYRPWKPGTQPTDAEILWDYIQKLQTDLSLTKDDLFLRTPFFATGQPYYSEEQQRRSEQGIFG